MITPKNKNNTVENVRNATKDISDIFREHFYKIKSKYSYPFHVLRAVESICQCRTNSLGTQIYKCDSCGEEHEISMSCGNRHCPKCQHEKRKDWLDKQVDRMLPIDYFHVVFTLPDSLNDLILHNQKILYGVLLKCVKETLMELGRDRLKADVGAIAILHTWGQNLSYHPHVHCVVTGGGINVDSKKWISSKKGYLLPVEVMSRLFKGKFLSYTKEMHQKLIKKGKEKLSYEELKDLLKPLYKKDWVVYSKKPFASSDEVFRYIGNYTHRVAISNNRIEKVDEDEVTFRYRDYKDKSTIKSMTLPVVEFMRRFLLHILPPNFVKIRYFGILANSAAKMRKLCMEVFEKWNFQKDKASKPCTKESKKCVKCNMGNMMLIYLMYRSRDRPYTRVS